MLSPDTRYPIEERTRSVVFLKPHITNPNIEVGDYTYFDGGERAAHFQDDNVLFGRLAKLKIGKFCALANGTKFILSDANHQMSGFSTYPFFIFGLREGLDLSEQRDTVVGNDVWFGHQSVVMPGVSVGDGAIIGARAVVTKDVPPYAVVAGNPAQVVRTRFPQPVVDELLEIRWWDWEIAKISRNVAAIIGGDLEALRKAHGLHERKV